jgi:carbamoyl-phosphate synthase / aspartate carbamoyltransferase
MSLQVRPTLSRTPSTVSGMPAAPVTAPRNDGSTSVDAVLELSDGSAFRGFSFGAEGKSVAGECVFQTGTV